MPRRPSIRRHTSRHAHINHHECANNENFAPELRIASKRGRSRGRPAVKRRSRELAATRRRSVISVATLFGATRRRSGARRPEDLAGNELSRHDSELNHGPRDDSRLHFGGPAGVPASTLTVLVPCASKPSRSAVTSPEHDSNASSTTTPHAPSGSTASPIRSSCERSRGLIGKPGPDLEFVQHMAHRVYGDRSERSVDDKAGANEYLREMLAGKRRHLRTLG